MRQPELTNTASCLKTTKDSKMTQWKPSTGPSAHVPTASCPEGRPPWGQLNCFFSHPHPASPNSPHSLRLTMVRGSSRPWPSLSMNTCPWDLWVPRVPKAFLDPRTVFPTAGQASPPVSTLCLLQEPELLTQCRWRQFCAWESPSRQKTGQLVPPGALHLKFRFSVFFL